MENRLQSSYFTIYALFIKNYFNETITIVKTTEAAASLTAEQPGTDHGFGKRFVRESHCGPGVKLQ